MAGNFLLNRKVSKKEVINYLRELPDRFTKLIDVFKRFVGRGGSFLVINETEDGITTTTIAVESDKNYVHNQTVSSLQWNVNHSLNKFPNVVVVDISLRRIKGTIEFVDNNNIIIYLEESLTGKVYCN